MVTLHNLMFTLSEGLHPSHFIFKPLHCWMFLYIPAHNQSFIETPSFVKRWACSSFHWVMKRWDSMFLSFMCSPFGFWDTERCWRHFSLSPPPTSRWFYFKNCSKVIQIWGVLFEVWHILNKSPFSYLNYNLDQSLSANYY